MKEEILHFWKGDIDESKETLDTYSHDASLFTIRPSLVLFPKDATDIQALVRYVQAKKESGGKEYEEISITMRAAGTDMSGGAINNSLIVDTTKYMNKLITFHPHLTEEGAGDGDERSSITVEPGMFYRDMEKITLEKGLILPSYTASKEICAVGGMVANNSGGEKAIKYGKTENYVTELDVILSDGSLVTVKAMTKNELEVQMLENTLYGKICRDVWNLLRRNTVEIADARPRVSKNSAGYYLWNIWDDEKQVFDLCKIFVGSQGTLGIVTKITFRLVPVEPYTNVLAIFLPDIKHLGAIVTEILPFTPDSLESYDDYSMKLAVRFFFDFFKQLGFKGAIKLGLQFLPEAKMLLTGGLPKLILLVEASGKTENEVALELMRIEKTVAHFGYKTHIAKSASEAEKYWKIRRESFNLLRKHVKGKRTAPFIDDVIVPPEVLPEFLPRLEALIKEYNLVYTIAGHAGNGNFHIIPLMDLDSPISADIILELSQKVYDLVLEYHGSITAEHNDGIIRTPFLEQMYGEKIYRLFNEVKFLFDPLLMFNPGKKVGGTKEAIRRALLAGEHTKHPYGS